MKPWLLIASAAAAATLAVVFARRSAASAPAASSVADGEGFAFDFDLGLDFGLEPVRLDEPAPGGLVDDLQAWTLDAWNTVNRTPASQMAPSAAAADLIRRLERCELVPYRLGDGGWTLGWGRYFPDSGPPPPERITQATADAWLEQDLEERGARWVRAYVTAPLTQAQFDALVSMAYNLSPRSFRTIAEAVNRGDDPEAAALQFVRAGTNLERGLRRRRALELALYRSDTEAFA